MRKLFLSFLSLLIIVSSFTNVSAAFIVPASTASEKPDPATVKAAMEAFNNLSKAERKEKIKELKKELKVFKAAKKAGNASKY